MLAYNQNVICSLESRPLPSNGGFSLFWANEMGTYTFKHEDDEGFVELSFDDGEYITHMEVTRRFTDFLNGCGFYIERCDYIDLNGIAREANKEDKKRLKKLLK